MIDTKGYGLRPEAQPYEYERLSESQKEAFKRLVLLIGRAVAELDRGDRPQKSQNVMPRSAQTFGLMENNYNRMSFLSGGRGSGKTSVLYSLIKQVSSDPYKIEEGQWKPNFKATIETLEKRVIWLRPIEMESLPTPNYMIASILARVEEVIDRFDRDQGEKKGGERNFTHLYHSYRSPDTIMEFEKLQRDVIKAWHGNLDEHSGSMDPDTYTVDVVETERCRLRFNEWMIKNFKDLNENYFGAFADKEFLFVLPLDDFDLNPSISIKLIKLIRLISVPQLFTIVSGDFKIAQNVFNLYAKEQLLYVNDRSTEVRQEVTSPSIPIVNRMAHENSSNAMRKLFPKSHIVELEPMNWEEVFGFNSHPECSDPTMTIGKMLKDIKVHINTIPCGGSNTSDHFVAGHNINNIHDFFNIEVRNLVFDEKEEVAVNCRTQASSASESKTLRKMVYTGPSLFEMNHRHVHDLWRFLRDNVCQAGGWGCGPEADVEFARDFAKELFVQSSNDGECLSKELCDELMKTAKEDCYGAIQLVTDNLMIENSTGPRIHFVNRSHLGQVAIGQPKDWTIKVKIPACALRESSPPIPLATRTAASLMFLHDHLILSEPSGIVGKSLMKKLEPPEWAYCLWPTVDDDELKIEWPLPLLRSLWGHDIFSRTWAEVWKWMEDNQVHADKRGCKSGQFERMLKYFWIRIGSRIFSGRESKLLIYREVQEQMRSAVHAHCSACGETPNDPVDVFGKELNASIKALIDEFDKNTGPQKTPRGDFAVDDVIRTFDKMIEREVLAFLPDLSKSGSEAFVEKDFHAKIIDELRSLIVNNGEISFCETILGRRETLIRSWLARVICIMSPESGGNFKDWDIFIHDYLIPVPELKSVFFSDDITHAVRQLRTQSAVKFYDHCQLSYITMLFDPIHTEEPTLINEHPIKAFSPCFQHIQRLSEAKKMAQNSCVMHNKNNAGSGSPG